MIIPTAQSVASIRFPAPICVPTFGGSGLTLKEEQTYIAWVPRIKSEIYTPTFVSSRWLASPSHSTVGDLVYWDLSFERIPARRTGTMVVNLKYMGRAAPADMNEVWD
jgi:hypothetical protein